MDIIKYSTSLIKHSSNIAPNPFSVQYNALYKNQLYGLLDLCHRIRRVMGKGRSGLIHIIKSDFP